MSPWLRARRFLLPQLRQLTLDASRAAMLRAVLGVLLVVAPLSGLALWSVSRSPVVLLATAIVILWTLAMLWLGRSGRRRAASVLLIAGLWSLTAAGTLAFGGLHSTSYLHILVVLVLAILLLGEVAGVVVALLTIALGGVLVSAHEGGWLPAPLIVLGPADLWLGHTQVVIAMTLCLGYTLWALSSALGLARSSERRARRAKQALEEEMQQHLHANRRRAATERQLRDAQKMQAIGTLAGGVAHDMNNILAVVMAEASVMRGEVDGTSVQREALDNILTACRRGRDMTRNLLGFARKGQYVKRPVVIGDTMAEVERILKGTISKKVKLEFTPPKVPLFVLGDPSQLSTGLMNLCLNAVDAMDGDGTLAVACRGTWLQQSDVADEPQMTPGLHAELTVTDDGCGMQPDVLDRALEPFFTTKSTGKGSGLGLSMVYGMAQGIGGRLLVRSAPDRGTTVTLQLPATSIPGASETRETEAMGVRAIQGQSVLLVDDEKMILRAGERMLRQLGYEVLTATDGAAAVEQCREHLVDICLVILDLRMPVMDGEETFDALRDIDPDLPILISTGEVDESVAERLMARGAAGLLAKPFEFRQLKRALKRSIPGLNA